MRKRLTWLLVTLGIAALVRRLKRRGGHAEPAPAASTDDPANELRRKLAESRSADEGENAPTPPETTVEERRAEVHEHGRAALDDMRSSGEES